MGELMNNAIFSMTEAKFAMGDFNQMVLNRTDKAQLKATAKRDNVAGFYLSPVLMLSTPVLLLYTCLLYTSPSPRDS